MRMQKWKRIFQRGESDRVASGIE